MGLDYLSSSRALTRAFNLIFVGDWMTGLDWTGLLDSRAQKRSISECWYRPRGETTGAPQTDMTRPTVQKQATQARILLR